MHKETARQDKSKYLSRRLFVERFALAFGIYPAGLALLGTGALASAFPQSGPDSIESSDVTYPATGATIKGYLSHPKGKGPFPGVIVIDRYLNLVEHGRSVSRRLASQGYAALTADLLSRKGGTDSFAAGEDQRKALRTVTEEEALGDMDASFRYMDSNPLVKKGDIAILGFEEGGQKSFLYATTNPKLKAAVIYYGSAPPDEKLKNIACPVLEFVGDKDTRVAPAVLAAQEKMKQLGKSYETKIYPGVDHSFFDETMGRYNQAAANDSWTVTLAFLKRNIG